MPRYVAFLRGVMPYNAKMAELRAAFEAGGFSNVKTVLASGNVVFDARGATESAIERRAEAAMFKTLGRAFHTIVRSQADLQRLLAEDPWRALTVPGDAKRVVTFMRAAPRPKPTLPVQLEGARIHAIRGREAFTTYRRVPGGNPMFMKLIGDTLGDEVTTRSWDTVARVAKA